MSALVRPMSRRDSLDGAIEHNERIEVVERWEHESGRPCVITVMHRMDFRAASEEGVSRLGPGYYCGYVKTSLAPAEMDAVHEGAGGVSIHGGVTYGPDADGWVGFDVAHAFDICVDEDGEPLPANLAAWMHETVRDHSITVAEWSPRDVRDEVDRLARQLAALETDDSNHAPIE